MQLYYSSLEIMKMIYLGSARQIFSYYIHHAVEFMPDYGKLLDRAFALYLPLIISSVRNRIRSIPSDNAVRIKFGRGSKYWPFQNERATRLADIEAHNTRDFCPLGENGDSGKSRDTYV